MFDDFRSKRVIMLAHCLLNQNSISDGTADLPSQFNEIIELLMTNHIGMIQLPCPELLCLGLNRRDNNGAKRRLLDENTRIRELMGEKGHITILYNKAEEIVKQIQEYRKYGFQVLGVIGVNRSPSCGIETTSRNGEEAPGQGVFIEVLSETLSKNGITLHMIGTKTSEKERSIEKIRQFIYEWALGEGVEHKIRLTSFLHPTKEGGRENWVLFLRVGLRPPSLAGEKGSLNGDKNCLPQR